MDTSKPVVVTSASAQLSPTTAPPKASDAAQSRFARAFYGPAPAASAGLREQALMRPSRQPDSNAELAAWSNAPWSPLAMSLSQPAVSSRAGEQTDMGELLSRLCSAMYVSDGSANKACVVLALDHVLPGAAAEIVQQGMHLTIRLRARSEYAYEVMSSQRDSLLQTLGEASNTQVQVVVVRHDERDDGGRGDG